MNKFTCFWNQEPLYGLTIVYHQMTGCNYKMNITIYRIFFDCLMIWIDRFPVKKSCPFWIQINISCALLTTPILFLKMWTRTPLLFPLKVKKVLGILGDSLCPTAPPYITSHKIKTLHTCLHLRRLSHQQHNHTTIGYDYHKNCRTIIHRFTSEPVCAKTSLVYYEIMICQRWYANLEESNHDNCSAY